MTLDINDGPIGHIRHWAQLKPEAIALAGPNFSYSWAELLNSVLQVAGQLQRAGIKGPALILANGEAERIYALACIYLGVVTASLPEGLSHSQLSELGFKDLVTADGSVRSDSLVVHRISPALSEPPTTTEHRWRSDETFKCVFSSGTTGKPKGAIFSFGLSNSRVEAASKHYMRQVPFFTLVGLGTTAGNTGMFLDFWRGSTNLVPSNLSENLKLIRKFLPLGIMGAPISLEGLAKEAKSLEDLSWTLEEAVSAGSFISPAIARFVAQALRCKVTNVYGSTEAGLIGLSDATAEESNVCTLYPDVQVEIRYVDEGSGAAGRKGFILVNTPYLVSGYLGDSASDGFEDGYFRSGDLGYLNVEGKLVLEGREDDLINLSGQKIDPRPLEAEAKEFFNLQEAASVLAINQAGKQFHIMLVVGDSGVDEAAIQKHLYSAYRTSAPQKVMAVSHLPRNNMGKLLRTIRINTQDVPNVPSRKEIKGEE